jgi:hypothetical protein
MQGAALLALVGEIEGNSLLERLKQLVQGVPRRKATGQFGNVSPIAAVLAMKYGQSIP